MKACRSVSVKAPRCAKPSYSASPRTTTLSKPSSNTFCKSPASFKFGVRSAQKSSSVRSFTTKSNTSVSNVHKVTYKPFYNAFAQKRGFAGTAGQHHGHDSHRTPLTEADSPRLFGTPLKTQDSVFDERQQEIQTTLTEHDTGAQAAEMIYGEKIVGDTSLTGHFGTRDNPVKVPAYRNHRIVGCLGGPDNEHDLLWHVVTKGYKTCCLSCGQFFELEHQQALHEPEIEVRQTAGVSLEEREAIKKEVTGEIFVPPPKPPKYSEPEVFDALGFAVAQTAENIFSGQPNPQEPMIKYYGSEEEWKRVQKEGALRHNEEDQAKIQKESEESWARLDQLAEERDRAMQEKQEREQRKKAQH